VCVVAQNGDVGCVGDEKTFEFGVLDREATDGDVAKAWVVEAIDIDGVVKAGGVNDGVAEASTDQRQ